MIEAAVLAALVVVPLFFNPSTERVFEPDKLAWLLVLALLALVGLVAAAASTGSRRLLAEVTAVDGAVVAAVAVVALATIHSVAPALSLWGAYHRGQGLIAVAAFGTVYAAARVAARRPGASDRWRRALGLALCAACIYAVLQRLGQDNVTFSGTAFTDRPFGPLGNPIFLGAFLIMVLPVLVVWLIEALAGRRAGGRQSAGLLAALFSATVLGLMALVLTQSRGPVLGALAGGAVLLVLWLAAAGRARQAAGVCAVAAAAVIGFSVLGVGADRLGRLGELTSTGSRTAEERMLVWDALATAAAEGGARSLSGYGPETAALVVSPRMPEALARLAPGQVFDRAHDAGWEWWVTGGLAGVGVWLLLYLAAFVAGLRRVGLVRDGAGARRSGAVMLLLALVGGGSAWRFLGPGVWALGATAGLLVGLVAAALWSAWRRPPLEGAHADVGARGGGKRADRPSSRAPLDARLLGLDRHGALQLALVAALAAHLVESAVGLPTAGGELLFWVYLALLAAPLAPAQGAVLTARGTVDEPAWWPDAAVDSLALATVAFAPLLVAGRPGSLGRPALWLLPLGLWVLGGLLARGAGWATPSQQALRVLPAAVLALALAALGTPSGAVVAYAVVLVACVGILAVALSAAPGHLAVPGVPVRAQVLAAATALACAWVGWHGALAPVLADTALRSGLDAAAGKDVATAGAQFERAVMLWPQQWTYAQYLAAVRIQEAFAADVDTSAARAAFRSAVDVLRVADGQVPESETALALASLYRGLGDREAHPTAQIDAWTTAEDWYQAALARAPLDPDVLVEGGRLRERFGDVKSAGRLYSKALDLQPALAVADMGLARSAMAQGDLAAAERALTAAGQLVGTGKLVTLATADDWAAGASAVQTAAMARALSGDREGARSSLEALGSGSSTDAVTAALLRWLDRPTAGQP